MADNKEQSGELLQGTLDAQNILRTLVYPFGDPVAVHGSPGQAFEDQQASCGCNGRM
jgi:hypothetical protein